jgi:hypothetical protein
MMPARVCRAGLLPETVDEASLAYGLSMVGRLTAAILIQPDDLGSVRDEIDRASTLIDQAGHLLDLAARILNRAEHRMSAVPSPVPNAGPLVPN